MRCKHCLENVKRHYSDYTNGWIHEHGDIWCRRTMADAEEAGA